MQPKRKRHGNGDLSKPFPYFIQVNLRIRSSSKPLAPTGRSAPPAPDSSPFPRRVNIRPAPLGALAAAQTHARSPLPQALGSFSAADTLRFAPSHAHLKLQPPSFPVFALPTCSAVACCPPRRPSPPAPRAATWPAWQLPRSMARRARSTTPRRRASCPRTRRAASSLNKCECTLRVSLVAVMQWADGWFASTGTSTGGRPWRHGTSRRAASWAPPPASSYVSIGVVSRYIDPPMTDARV